VCFPGIRILFSGGHLAVAIFFVISGYVLSAGPLRSIHAKDTIKTADRIGSALFRRWLRLFIPVLATTFIWMTTWHLFGIRSSNPIAAPPEKTYAAEIWKWYCDALVCLPL
jgi:peptidoglycan/LPS O-acetylase OafA/YrhL